MFPSLDPQIFNHPPATRDEFIRTRLSSKLWRINNLYTIVDKGGDRIQFRMNASQLKVYASYLVHPRLVILKSRQQGISTFWLIFFFDSAVFGDDVNIGLMAQGKSEASTLLKRVKIAWDMLDDSIKGFLNIGLGKNNTEEFSFTNDSTIFIRTSFRSATLQGLHVSEYGKIANKYPERARETKTGTLQAIKPGLPVAIESTAEGNNDFKRIWDTAYDMQLSEKPFSGKDFYPVFLSWLDDPDCQADVPQELTPGQEEYFSELELELGISITDQQRWFWVAQYRELGDDIYQEYPATPEEAFTVTKDGTYYAKLYRTHVIKKKREVSELYDANLDVHVAMDLGMNDTFTLVFFQKWRIEWRIIDEYANSGEGLAHYVEVIKSKAYKYGTIYLPHDVRVRELSTGMSRLHKLRKLGIHSYKVLPKVAINDGIEAVRSMLFDLWIDPKCIECIMAFKNYSKEWDDRLSNWKNKPLHNEYSHFADSIRYMAIGHTESAKQSISASNARHTSVVDGLAL